MPRIWSTSLKSPIELCPHCLPLETPPPAACSHHQLLLPASWTCSLPWTVGITSADAWRHSLPELFPVTPSQAGVPGCCCCWQSCATGGQCWGSHAASWCLSQSAQRGRQQPVPPGKPPPAAQNLGPVQFPFSPSLVLAASENWSSPSGTAGRVRVATRSRVGFIFTPSPGWSLYLLMDDWILNNTEWGRRDFQLAAI